MANIIREYASLESVIADLRKDQEPKDRLHYREIIMEAIDNSSNPNGKATMIQTLYKDILSKSSIDFGKIPDSNGDITKYTYYDQLYKSLEILNKLLSDRTIEELELTNKLHDMIIACRADFEFGYKFDIELIKLVYQSLVLTLHEMINICIVSYVDYLKDTQNKEFEFKTFKSKDLLVVKSLKGIIASYEKGEWQQMMHSFKKDPKGLFGAGGGATLIGVAIAAPLPLKVIAAVIGILFAIRGLVYIYFNTSVKIRDYVTIQKSLIDLNIDHGNDNLSAIEKQRKMSEALSSIAGVIEAKILKTDIAAKKDIHKDNKENYSPAMFKEAQQITKLSNDDIQLV